MGGCYPNNNFSYSFDSFQFLVLGSIDNDYPEILEDLQHLYLETFPTDRIIDLESYQTGLLRSRTIA